MPSGHYTQSHLKAFSDCLNRIYEEPTGENPTQAIFDAIERLVRINSVALNLISPDSQLIHVADRHLEGIQDLAARVPEIAIDHPGIHWTLKNGPIPAQKLSDFVSQREIRELSLYDITKEAHPLADQAVMLAPTSQGLCAFLALRDKTFTNEEFFLLQLLQPHIHRVLNRCALFATFPGNVQLTAREQDVLFWISHGKTDDEIAMLLKAKPRTINAHVLKILNKLGVDNRASAISMLLSNQSSAGPTGSKPDDDGSV